MKSFLDNEFLLKTKTASILYHEYAEDLPIADCHCHLSPEEIATDKRWSNLSELWLGGDHYKWRALRSDGVDEYYITGGASPYEKFEKYAALMPRLIGNPLYHWSHLELKRYFGVDEPLNAESCRRVWEQCSDKLKDMSAKSLITRSKVRLIYTTDDPVDELNWHRSLSDFETKVLPAWRPDKAMNIDKPGFIEYMAQLGAADFDALKSELIGRMDYFHALGCRNSDHGLDYIPSRFTGRPDVIFKKALQGQPISVEEAESYKTGLLLFLARQYRLRGWVMQLHYGAVRNVNPVMFNRLGADTGYDAIWGRSDNGAALGALLGKMEESDALPKTVLYSLNPADNAQLGAILGCFQGSGLRCKLQHGSAWWLNDSKRGMEEQISSLASLSVLPDFIGMVTDSRSFLSYTRHEYFRRILCNVLGTWVEDGEYPADMEALGQMVRDISYYNALSYFGEA